jgi:hypothetical protein
VELHTPRPTAKAPAQAFTEDVYVTPVHSGQEPSRMTVATAADTFLSHLAMLESLPGGEDPTTWLEPVADEDYQKADGR